MILVVIWSVTFIVAQYPPLPHLYVQVAPWWHIALFLAWFAVQFWTIALFVIWIYERPLRKHRKLTHQPPQHAG
jgi:hypothetical protein